MIKMDQQMKLRVFLFISVTAVICLLLFFPLRDLLFSKAGGMFYEYYSHIYLIPLVSAYLLFIRRDEIWASGAYALPFGLPVVAVGLIGYGAALAQGASLDFIDGVAWRIALPARGLAGGLPALFRDPGLQGSPLSLCFSSSLWSPCPRT